MITFIILVVIALILIVALKKLASGLIDPHKVSRDEASKRIIEAEREKMERYNQQKKISKNESSNTSPSLPEPKRTSADILKELLEQGLWKVIEVDAELVFKRANYKEQYYLHASHYFPEREEVYGKNADGKIVWVDLYDQKEATHPDTGDRIPGIKKYLRSNAV